jgi:hypothetical protein
MTPRGRARLLGVGVVLIILASRLTSAGGFGASEQPPTDGPVGAPGSFAASSASTAADPYIVEEMLTQHRFENTGAGTRRERTTVRIVNQAGVGAFSTLVFRYMAATEQVSVQQLTVEKPDGRKISPPSLALDEAAAGTIDATILDDLRAKRIAVPALEPGDRLTYDVKRRESAGLGYPRVFVQGLA